MKTIPLILTAALVTTVSTGAFGATNRGGAGSLNQIPTPATTDATGTANPTPPNLNAGSPNSGSMPAPGMKTGNSPTVGAESSGTTSKPERPSGPGNPATEAQRSTALEIAFAPGDASLSAVLKQKIDQTMRDARARGQIVQVNVIGWGDVAYPAAKQEVPAAERQLAARRSMVIENYIENRNNGVKVDSINMAERPTALEDLLNSSEARVKQTLESSGLVGAGSNRASRAMVMVIVR